MTKPSNSQAGSRLAQIGPALLGASSFACADVLSKVALNDGADALTISAVRAVLGLAMLFAWLRLAPPSGAFSPRAKWISLGLGVLFAGNVFLLFKSFETVEVPIAILTYFVYPLLTGLAAAASGLETITWRGAAAAIVAFLGLALMIGVHPTTLAAAGILAALVLSRVLRSFLFEVEATDPVTLIGVGLLFAIVALLACWAPTRRAVKVDPLEVLRYE